MKKISLLLLFFITVSCSIFDKTKDGDYTVTNSDLKDFNYRSIEGTLTITGEDITDISNLSSLKEVGGIAIVRTSLTNLNGLRNITGFTGGTGDIRMQQNDNLVDVSALSGLSGSIGLLRVQENPLLEDFRSLGISSGGSIRIENAPIANLMSLNLPSQMDEIKLGGLLNLISLNGLQQVSELNRLEIGSGVPGLTNLDDASQLTQLKELLLLGTRNLSDISGMMGVNISEKIILSDLFALTSLDGLQGARSLDFLSIHNLWDLTSLEGLNNLEQVGINVEQFDDYRAFTLSNLGISSLSGLDNLRAVRDITIRGCDQLISLDGAQITNNGSLDFARWIRIGQNGELRDFCGLTEYAISSEFDIYTVQGNRYNPSLELLRDPDRCSI